MSLLGSVLFVLGLCVITPIFSLIALLIFWAPAKFRYDTINLWNRSVIFMARWFCRIRHEVVGMENLPDPPYVICSKHQSAWETMAYPQIFPRVSFVVKRSLLLIPFFGWGMWICMNVIPIDRNAKISAFRAILSKGKRRFDDNISVCVFPEGTRLKVGQRKPFMPGACMLAVEGGVPVVPVALNSGRCWPRTHFGFFKKPGTITMSIGPAIETKGRRTREVTALAEKWVNEETSRIGG